MTRKKAYFYSIIYGLPDAVSGAVAGGSRKFETKADLNDWIKKNGIEEHPGDFESTNNYGILPDGRAVQIFHGHLESLTTKVEIG